MTEITQPQVVQTSTPISKFMVVLLIGAAFIVGMLYTKVQTLQEQVLANGGSAVAKAGGNAPEVAGAANDDSLPTANGEVKVTPGEDYILGDPNADLVFVEYSDLECPYCQQFHPTMQRVMQEYEGKVAWVYKHFPLTSIHPAAQKEAEAAECAGEQAGNEMFWDMIDSLMSSRYTGDQLVTLAGEKGLDTAAFKTCLDSGRFASKVAAQTQEGQSAGVTGTPGTVMVPKSGESMLVPGALPYEQLKTAIDGLL